MNWTFVKKTPVTSEVDEKTGRKVYRYVGADGVPGKLVSRRQHLLELKSQGKLAGVDIDKVNFSRKRSLNLPTVGFNYIDYSLSNDKHEISQTSTSGASSHLLMEVLSENQSCEIHGSEGLNIDNSHKVSTQVKNEVLKKDNALRSLQIASSKDVIDEACSLLEQVRLEEQHCDRICVDLKDNLLNLLSKEGVTYNELGQTLLERREVREFFTKDLVQECLAFGGRRNLLKRFPPDLSNNLAVEFLNEILEST